MKDRYKIKLCWALTFENVQKGNPNNIFEVIYTNTALNICCITFKTTDKILINVFSFKNGTLYFF